MKEYQEKYIENTKKIKDLANFYSGADKDLGTWLSSHIEELKTVKVLRDENNRLLSEGLFPDLDRILSASDKEIKELSDFADILLDWKTNLDPGVYLVVHEALLRLFRIRKDRDAVIKELYMIGMGLYYTRRYTEGVECDLKKRLSFRNEMVFTEASSYLRYFEEIKDPQTRGYIIRALHNITLCDIGLKRRIAINTKALKVMKDEYYRELEPSLPWDRFVRASHQQMSSHRNGLSKSNLSKEEIALVLDACYEIFKPEQFSQNQSIRWVWPYYDMEYNCGYADLDTTLKRLVKLIDSTPYDRYDESGLYGNVQLATILGQLLREHPILLNNEDNIRFLDKAYKKMLKCLISCPPEKFEDNFFFIVDVAITNFHEVEGCLSYKELASHIMKRFSGDLFIRSRKAGDIMKIFCNELLKKDPSFFDDIPFISQISDADKKKSVILDYAATCGLFSDFGLIKMNLERTMKTRNLFEDEKEAYEVHTISGHDDLKKRKSTERYADIAYGCYRWYDGTDGYPKEYVRNKSNYRQMVDVAAAALYMTDSYNGDIESLAKEMLSLSRKRFSPMVVSCLLDDTLKQSIDHILGGDDTSYYKELYDALK